MVKAARQAQAVPWPGKVALVLVGATAVLLAVGAVVNPMGASLACPDWVFLPTCDGKVFPPMVGGVLFEHGHRLWATLVGMLTVVVALGAWGGGDRTTRVLGLVAVGLVVLQGTLGGVTVLLKLHPLVSTLHLVTAFAFLCLTLELAHRLGGLGSLATFPYAPRRLARATLGVAFLQVALGGAVRHMGAAMACGIDWIGCGPAWWPSHGLGHLHMTHRLVGYLLAAKVLLLCARAHGRARGTVQRMWAWLPTGLVAAQVVLGWLSVASLRSVAWVVLHTCGAVLLVGVLFLFEKASDEPKRSEGQGV
ncbi:MAG: COX15/CtaA family protein [Myxococcota bacterium]